MNILFLAFEGGEAQCMGQLANRFKAAGHRIFIASLDHFSVTHTRGEVVEHYRSVGIAASEYDNLDSVFADVNRQPTDLPRDAVDWDYLRHFEEKYCKRFTLLQLAAMDPVLLRIYHHRTFYYHPKNKNLLMKNIELQIRWLESIFDKMNFDVIFTINFQYFLKAVAYTMADALGIPFLMLQSSRIQDVHLVFDNYSLGTPRAVVEEMARLQAEHAPCAEAVAFMEEMRRGGKASYTDIVVSEPLMKKRLRLRSRLWEILYYAMKEPKQTIVAHKHYRGFFRPNFFLPSYVSVLRSMIVALSRCIGYFRRPELTRTDLPDGSFVFFPLHLVPENAVLTLSHTLDEKECLFQLSKALPPHWRIVVKINANMAIGLDTHPNRYYLDMNRLANVQFVNPLISSGAILPRASAVACISGTALLEGVIHGKPAFRWGHVPFEAVDMVMEFDPARMREVLERPQRSANVQYYIQACLNVGIRINQALLLRTIDSPVTELERADIERQLSQLEQAIYRYIKPVRRTARSIAM
jgi:hypothetical protein